MQPRPSIDKKKGKKEESLFSRALNRMTRRNSMKMPKPIQQPQDLEDILNNESQSAHAFLDIQRRQTLRMKSHKQMDKDYHPISQTFNNLPDRTTINSQPIGQSYGLSNEKLKDIYYKSKERNFHPNDIKTLASKEMFYSNSSKYNHKNTIFGQAAGVSDYQASSSENTAELFDLNHTDSKFSGFFGQVHLSNDLSVNKQTSEESIMLMGQLKDPFLREKYSREELIEKIEKYETFQDEINSLT